MANTIKLVWQTIKGLPSYHLENIYVYYFVSIDERINTISIVMQNELIFKIQKQMQKLKDLNKKKFPPSLALKVPSNFKITIYQNISPKFLNIPKTQ